jgi:hypothetical protein
MGSSRFAEFAKGRLIGLSLELEITHRAHSQSAIDASCGSRNFSFMAVEQAQAAESSPVLPHPQIV